MSREVVISLAKLRTELPGFSLLVFVCLLKLHRSILGPRRAFRQRPSRLVGSFESRRKWV